MDKAAIDAFVGNGPDSAFTRSILTPAPDNYENDVIRFIRTSGVVPENAIEISHGCISSYDENGKMIQSGIANAGAIEFVYKQQYERFRNKRTRDSLKDGDAIYFSDKNAPPPEEDESSEEGELVNGLHYKAFMAKTFDLERPDDIVLESSFIDIFYSNPCWKERVTFTIWADDPMKGFTRKELAIKAMQRFHLLYYLCDNYNMEEGKIDPERSTCSFSPVLYLNEYTDNGLYSLCYQIEEKRWEFITIDYV